jgi:zinc protease
MRWTDSVVREVLPSGLTLLVQRDSSVPVVAVVTHVKAGYFDEPDEWVGIAHVLEHMMFKGTPRYGPGQLARETQLLGGYLNASTIYDKTVFYATVPASSDALTRTLALQADVLMHAALDPGELSRELEVIVQEAKRKLDTPGALTIESLYALLFTAHRMRRWRIGTEAGLRRLTAADVRAYYESRYVPERVIVALAGDLDPDHALTRAREIYGGWASPAPPLPAAPVEPPARPARLQLLRGDVERPLAAVGWRTVGPSDADAPALDVAAEILGVGQGSWLAQAVRRPGLASATGSTHYTVGDVGVFDASLATDTATLPAALERTLALAERLADTGPDPAQLARVRALLATHWARRLESADGRATTLAEFEALGDFALADQYLEQLVATDADAVRAAARRYLARDVACAAVYLPRAATVTLAEGAWPLSPSALTAPTTVASALPHGRRPARSRQASDLPGAIGVLRLPGADVLVRRRAGLGLVSLGVHFPGIPTQEDAANAGISRLLARSALRGAGGLDADRLAVAAESLGGTVAAMVGGEIVGWAMSARADAADQALALLRLVAGAPTLDPDAVVVERNLQVDDAARARDDMFQYPLQRVLYHAFPGHVYGLSSLGEPDVLRGIDAAAVQAWHARVAHARALVTVVGDLEPDRLLEVGAALDSWPGRSETPHLAPPAWAGARAIEERDKAQTALALAFAAPGAAADERYALAVLAALLSGLAGRLFDELRERRALAYTVQAMPWLRSRAGAMLAYIATAPERESEARDAMLAELARVAREPVGLDELERARQYAAGLVAIRRQAAGAVASELVSGWVNGTLEAFAVEDVRRRAVTAEQVAAAAQRVFVADGRAEFVLRGRGAGR